MNSTEDYTAPVYDYYDNVDDTDYRCRLFLELSYDKIALYLSFLLGAPLHIYIIYRLCKNVSKKRAYHYFVIVQSVIDVINLSFGPLVYTTV